MRISELPFPTFARRLREPGLVLRTGPIQFHVRTPVDLVSRALHLLYGDFPLLENVEYADYHVSMRSPGLRRIYRPNVQFYADDSSPFKPLPLDQAVAMLEWCMNWTITSNAHHFLIIHAGCIERQGKAVVLAAPPGSGKSTLTAALVCRGWRLLSDELTLLRPSDGYALPLARPIALKNVSIDLIRDFGRDTVFGPVAPNTLKGAVAHLKTPRESVDRMHDAALPRYVIFPRFQAGSPALLTPYKKANALLHLADNAFNYGHHGIAGFECLSDLIDRSACYEFTYSSLDEAIGVFDQLGD